MMRVALQHGGELVDRRLGVRRKDLRGSVGIDRNPFLRLEQGLHQRGSDRLLLTDQAAAHAPVRSRCDGRTRHSDCWRPP